MKIYETRVNFISFPQAGSYIKLSTFWEVIFQDLAKYEARAFGGKMRNIYALKTQNHSDKFERSVGEIHKHLKLNDLHPQNF
jgi:hypothetical protein